MRRTTHTRRCTNALAERARHAYLHAAQERCMHRWATIPQGRSRITRQPHGLEDCFTFPLRQLAAATCGGEKTGAEWRGGTEWLLRAQHSGFTITISSTSGGRRRPQPLCPGGAPGFLRSWDFVFALLKLLFSSATSRRSDSFSFFSFSFSARRASTIRAASSGSTSWWASFSLRSVLTLLSSKSSATNLAWLVWSGSIMPTYIIGAIWRRVHRK